MNTYIYIIAEIGINHNGSLKNCLAMVDAAATAGCNAAKVQTFSADRLYPKSAGRLDWKDLNRQYDYDIYETVKRFELPLEWVDRLIEHCEEKGVDFISSVFDIPSLELLLLKGLKIIKLSSYTITHLPLIEACAKTGLPIIMSTGGANLGETEEAVATVLKYHKNLKLLHCSIQYPTALKDCNLGVMETMRLAFPGVEIGYSDHTIEVSDAPVQSIYLGGKIVEKHIALDKGMEGPDHFFALEPDELKQMVADTRLAEKNYSEQDFAIDPLIYGSTAKVCHEHERYLRDFAYMTLFAARTINKGEIIQPEDIVVLRPGKMERGLDPKFLFLFEQQKIMAKKDLAAESPITWETVL
jgi:N,N'-diacetyllegionaminate synthase